jgi:hypothetical protein
MIVSYSSTAQSRERILQLLTQAKVDNSSYKVIDVGGVVNGWSAPIADLVVDINAPNDVGFFNMDICRQVEWTPLLDSVNAAGLFDFAICTHVLEDIYDPFVVLDNLPRIAKAGIITMPSIRTELSNIESTNWLGYIHHRWIFSEQDGKMLIIPKISMLESLCRGSRISPKKAVEEVQFEWSSEIPHIPFMDNYLGPNASTVINNYNNIINNISI